MTDRKTVLKVQVDASDVPGELEKLKGQTVKAQKQIDDEKEKSRKQNERADEKSNKTQADGVDRTTKSIIASIERATAAAEAGGRNTAAYYEQIGRQRGVSGDALAPYIAKLREAEKLQAAATSGLGDMGMSARATAAALRGVPAQFTDIITSLQGGQAPLTVLLQQGGQLKDQFGGAGAAAQALVGYIRGLITPTSVALGSIGLIAAGFLAGQRESAALQRSLILAGNQAGVTASQVGEIAKSLDGIGGTRGNATNVLTKLAEDGRVGAESLERFAAAAIAMERAAGPAAEETAKAFSDLGKDPLQAALKLNDATGFLTRSTYEQIKALTEQGRTVEAARVAQEAYASTLEGRIPQLEAQLGLLERAWRGVKSATAEAWDVLKAIGRDNTAAEQIAALESRLAGLNLRRATSTGFLGQRAGRQAEDVQAQLDALRETVRLEASSVQRNAERVQQLKAKADFDKAGAEFTSKQVRMERELAQAKELGAAAGESAKVIEDRLSDIRAKYAEKTRGAVAAQRTFVDSLRDKIEALRVEAITLAKGEAAGQLYAAGKDAESFAVRQAAAVYEQELKTLQKLRDEKAEQARINTEGLALTRAMQTEEERLNDERARAQELLERGAISSETYRRAIVRFNEDAQKASGRNGIANITAIQPRMPEGPEWQRMISAWQDTSKLIEDGLDKAIVGSLKAGEDAFVRFTQTGKLSGKELVNSLLADFARLAFQRGIAALFNALAPSANTGVPLAGDPFGARTYAKGGTFGVQAFASGGTFGRMADLVSSPTLFKFANGGAMRTGVMGEAGPEAVMPLRRTPSGRLGVEVAANNSTFAPVIHIHGATDPRAVAMQVNAQLARYEQRRRRAGG